MANTSTITNVISNDFFQRYNDMDLVYAKGLVNPNAKKYVERLKKANEKARQNSSSIFDNGAFKLLEMDLDKLAKTAETSVSASKVRVVGSEPAKEREVVATATRPIMNEQVVTNALGRTEEITLEPVGVEQQQTLTLGRIA